MSLSFCMTLKWCWKINLIIIWVMIHLHVSETKENRIFKVPVSCLWRKLIQNQSFETGIYLIRPVEDSRAPEIHRPCSCSAVQWGRRSLLVFPPVALSRNYHYALNVIHCRPWCLTSHYFFSHKKED